MCGSSLGCYTECCSADVVVLDVILPDAVLLNVILPGAHRLNVLAPNLKRAVFMALPPALEVSQVFCSRR